mmetsp:Transcript_5395/g.9429  ORF Transcript_5395/g.9429 Transcript_5395/m.9429 type:complete len:228 (+) Transcript_5395:2-685(+)
MRREVSRGEPYYTNKVDVYSFAIVLWQLLTREATPYAGIRDSEEVARLVAMEQCRLPFPNGTPEALKNLIKTNWSDDPSRRMTCFEIKEKLQELRQSIEVDQKDGEWIESPRIVDISRIETADQLNMEKQNGQSHSLNTIAQDCSRNSNSSNPPSTKASFGKVLHRKARSSGSLTTSNNEFPTGGKKSEHKQETIFKTNTVVPIRRVSSMVELTSPPSMDISCGVAS